MLSRGPHRRSLLAAVVYIGVAGGDFAPRGAGRDHAANVAGQRAAAERDGSGYLPEWPARPATRSTATARRRASSGSHCRCLTATTFRISATARAIRSEPLPCLELGRARRRAACVASIATCRHSATRFPTSRSSSVVKHLWTLCTDPSWPRGDMNFPRAFFTEKAFPENEIGLDRRLPVQRGQGGHQRLRLRASHQVAEPVRSPDSGRLPADVARRRVEPRPR